MPNRRSPSRPRPGVEPRAIWRKRLDGLTPRWELDEPNRPVGPSRLRVLFVLVSTNQLYSGIGRAIRELASRMTGRMELEFAIDDQEPRNVELLARFAEAHGMPVHIGRNRQDPGYPDPINEDLPALLAERRWDVIELVSWANAATNRAALEGAAGSVVAYTPHSQPTWTVAMPPPMAANVEAVHRRLLREADLVFCDSRLEYREQCVLEPRARNVIHLPLGCDFGAFQPGRSARKPQLLFVGDLLEVRKRFDRVLAVFDVLLGRHPELRLLVVGNRSERWHDRLPESIRHACDLRGYVSEAELQRAYAESRGLLLLSDYKAFGLPILEALACGTPVFLARQAATEGLFSPFHGVHICPGDDPLATAGEVGRSLARGEEAHAEIIAERPRLLREFDWGGLATRKWEALASAWFRKHWWSVSA